MHGMWDPDVTVPCQLYWAFRVFLDHGGKVFQQTGQLGCLSPAQAACITMTYTACTWHILYGVTILLTLWWRWPIMGLTVTRCCERMLWLSMCNRHNMHGQTAAAYEGTVLHAR
jgi:hypothetical protein